MQDSSRKPVHFFRSSLFLGIRYNNEESSLGARSATGSDHMLSRMAALAARVSHLRTSHTGPTSSSGVESSGFSSVPFPPVTFPFVRPTLHSTDPLSPRLSRRCLIASLLPLLDPRSFVSLYFALSLSLSLSLSTFLRPSLRRLLVKLCHHFAAILPLKR